MKIIRLIKAKWEVTRLWKLLCAVEDISVSIDLLQVFNTVSYGTPYVVSVNPNNKYVSDYTTAVHKYYEIRCEYLNII